MWPVACASIPPEQREEVPKRLTASASRSCCSQVVSACGHTAIKSRAFRSHPQGRRYHRDVMRSVFVMLSAAQVMTASRCSVASCALRPCCCERFTAMLNKAPSDSHGGDVNRLPAHDASKHESTPLSARDCWRMLPWHSVVKSRAPQRHAAVKL